MRDLKKHKTKEILHRLAAEYVRDNASPSSLLTITRVELNDSGKDAQIFFTTLPSSEEDTALKFLQRKTSEFQQYARENSRIGIIPHIRFLIDFGERNRQHLDTLL